MRLHITLVYSLNLLVLLLSENFTLAANGESRFGWSPSSSPTPRPRGLASERTLAPAVTLLPPDWNDNAKVDIDGLGIIQGVANLTFPLLSPTTRKFYWFAGIPYAKPDSYTKDNRFKPSVLWEDELLDESGTFLATDYSVKCPQSGDLKNTMGFEEVFNVSNNEAFTGIQEHREDCLVLNINTPRLPANAELLPVIVHIHGGSFDSMWSGLYLGHRFLKEDIIFVSLNYRLGLFGFLNLGIDGAPGNAALYDIVTALRWIKRYIHYFGGDKNKVTVSGHSAGAVLASHLLTSDLAFDGEEPLLHRIIGLSGSSLSQTLATCTDPLRHHLRVSDLAGCHDGTSDTPNLQEIRDCLARKPISELLEAMNKYTISEISEGRFGLDAKLPSLQDPSKLKIPAFITETPYNVLIEGKQKLNIPVMMGVTRHDGSYLVDQTLEQFWRPRNYTNDPLLFRNDLLPTLIDALNLEDSSGELVHSLEKMYVGNAMHKDDFDSKIPGLIDIFSVLAFKAGAYNLAELNAKMNKNSYYFSFEYSGVCSVDNGQYIPKGIGHMDSLFYLFPSSSCLLILPNDISVSNRFINYWVNFATYGNPNGEGPKTIAAPYNPLNHAYLVIDGSDRTAYYCRDSWINNSLELVKEPQNPSPTTTGTTGEVSSTTRRPGDDSSTASTINVYTFLLSFFAVFTLIEY